MSEYHEMVVSYLLSDTEMELLKEITRNVQSYVMPDGSRPFADQTVEGMFDFIMNTGVRKDIKERFGFSMVGFGMMSIEDWSHNRSLPIEDWKMGTAGGMLQEKKDEKG